MCALAAKCQAQIKEKSPSGFSYSSHTRTITISPPSPLLSYKSSSSFSSTTASCSSTAVSSASLPRNRAYLSLRSCKQSNSKLPAIVTHGVTVTTEPGEALRIAEEKDVKERMRKGKEERSDPLRGTLEAEVSTHLIGSRLWCEKIPANVEERVRSKIGRDCRKITNETEEMIKNFMNVREHSMIGTYMMIDSNRPIEEREKIAHFRYPPLCFPIFRSLTRYRRTGEMDRIWTIPHLCSRPTRSCQGDRSVYDELGAQCAATGALLALP